MKFPVSFRLQLATASLATALVAGGCSMMEPKAERYVAPPLGSTWVSSQRDTGSYGSGSSMVPFKSAERLWQGNVITARVSPGAVTLVNSNGNFVALLAPDDKPIITWSNPVGFEFPLVVGKTWTRRFETTVHATKKTFSVEGTFKVEGYEDVTVPAGTFKAFKIGFSSSTAEETYWFVPELGIEAKQIQKRTANSPFGPGTREIELVSQTIRK